MGEYITLLGAEDVRTAASRMSSAAEEMKRAAASIEDTLFRHQRWLDEWLVRYEAVLDNYAT